MATDETVSSLTEQVESLYDEKHKLKRELGVSSADAVIEMVRSLQDQVEALYAEKDDS
jgi:hypothetical protein